jgi:DNA replication protein DnaC
LLTEEVARRKQTRLQRCTRGAHFPFFKTIDEFDFTLQSTLRESVIGSYLGLDFVTEGRSLILHGKTGRGKTHLAVAIGYRAIQNGFETLFTTAAKLIEDLSNPRGEPVISTWKRPCQKIQNGSEFPELVAQIFRNPHKLLKPLGGEVAESLNAAVC